MSQIRIYIENQIKKNEYIILEKKHSHYLKNVMRRQSGDIIIIFNNHEEWDSICEIGVEFLVKPRNLLRKKNKIQDIWICFGLVKPKNIDFLIEKTSEIGVTKFLPMKTQYSNSIKLNYERLRRISIEAIEQSNSLNLPIIEESKNIEDILSEWDDERVIVFCDEKGGSPILNFKNLLRDKSKYAIFIGPVGGWNKNERQALMRKNNLHVNFGDNILKADTAAIYCLASLKSNLL